MNTTTYKYPLLFLSLIAGAVFLFSAYTKLIPIQGFEYTLIDDAYFTRKMAAFAARCFIGLEGGLGTLMVFHFYGKSKWVLKASFALVIIFSFYLIYLWIAKGSVVNCGCFGDTVFMKPGASLAKNGFLLAAIGILIKYQPGFSYRWAAIAAPFLLLVTLVLPFIIFPVFKPYKFNFTAIYTGKQIPRTDLRKGKHIIAFLSPTCIYCQRAGHKMYDDLKADTTLPFYIIIGGLNTDLRPFWKASQAQNIRYIRIASDPFMKYTSGVFPYIIWVNNGVVEEETGYSELSTAAIEKWMATK